VEDRTVLSSRLAEFLGHVARADDADELQRRYLDGVGAFVPASAAGLYILDPHSGGTEVIAARGVSDFFLSRYEEFGRHHDPVLCSVAATRHAVDSAQLMAPDQWTRMPVYERVFGLHRMHNLLEAPLVVDDRLQGTLNFGRTDTAGAFDPADRVMAQTIAQLLSVALASRRQDAALRRERDQVVAALELCSEAVVITDLDAAERRTNGAARRVLDRLRDGASAVDDLLIHPVRGRGETSRCEVPVVGADGTPDLLVGRSTRLESNPSLVITFIELLGTGVGDRSRALSTHGLTPRETEVARLAARGLHDPEIASHLHLSPYTVKQYLRAVYRKLGVRSRVELARLRD
jgi:DNA-binding CsgD family transcriptional regulator/GAF domain-containing protein